LYPPTWAHTQPNFQRLRDALTSTGFKGLSETNGLTPAENDLLCTSPDHQLIVALLLKGLAARRAGPGGTAGSA
jgi:hypothetical protein